MVRFTYDTEPWDYDPPEDRVYKRGCTCNSLSIEPCRYCEGDYACPGGCGSSYADCQCPPTWDELSEEDQKKRIEDAFNYLCERGEVPYGIQTGDDGVWDEYDPAIELAEEWYENERSE